MQVQDCQPYAPFSFGEGLGMRYYMPDYVQMSVKTIQFLSVGVIKLTTILFNKFGTKLVYLRLPPNRG
jgi:hypothetical protein